MRAIVDKIFSVREPYVMWEREPSLGCFFKTSWSVLLSPREFFPRIREGRSILLALLFGVIADTTGGLLGLIWVVLLQRQAVEGIVIPSHFMLTYSLFLPLLSTIGILITSLFFHFFLLLFRGANEGFKVTLKAVSYGQASQLVNTIPLLGPVFATLYGFVIYIIALKEAHGTDYPRAFLSVLIPFLLSVFFLLVGLYSFISPSGRL